MRIKKICNLASSAFVLVLKTNPGRCPRTASTLLGQIAVDLGDGTRNILEVASRPHEGGFADEMG